MITLLLIIVLISASCSSGNTPQSFPLPEIPAIINSQEEALNYIVTHYWDEFFSPERKFPTDTSLIGGIKEDAFEKAYREYLTYLGGIPLATALKEQKSLMEKAEACEKKNPDSRVWDKLVAFSGKYLFDPNSPLRSEELYIPVLEKLISSPFANNQNKATYERLLPLCKLNRIGSKANDFSFTLRNGRKMDLHNVKADYTILLFSNPDCNNCKEIIDFFKNLNGINTLIEENRIAILNIYPDPDLSAWFEYSEQYPKEWINGYDPDGVLKNDSVYYIKAIPCIYLLDKEKTVILKDAPAENIIRHLQQILK